MKFYILFTICTFFSTMLFSQKENSEINVISENMKSQEIAWNNGNIPEFMKYYWNNDSLKFIGSKGITYGWKNTLDNYLQSYPTKEDMGILTFTINETTQLSETSIYVIGKWELLKENSIGGYFTLLWKKIDGQWVIVSDHTS